MSKVNYKIKMGSKEKNYHINMLKLYNEREDENAIASGNLCIGATMVVLKDGDDIDGGKIIEVCPLRLLESWHDVNINENLAQEQRGEVEEILKEQKEGLTSLPGHTELGQHCIRTTTDELVRDKIYPIPYAFRKTMMK